MDDRLAQTGLRKPVTAIWFSRSRAADVALVSAALAGMGTYMTCSFYIDPGQVVTGRGRGLLDAGNGTGGILIGLMMLGLGLWFMAHGLARLTTRRPALVIAENGLYFDGTLTRQAFLPWEAVERVLVQRVKVSRGHALLPERRDFRLTIIGRAPPGQKTPTIRVSRHDVKGGVRSMRQFARSATCALRLTSAGRG